MARKSVKTPQKEALALSEHELEERGQTTLVDTAANAAEPPQTKTKAKTRAKTRTTPKKAAEKPQDASKPKATAEPTPEPPQKQNESATAAVSADPLHGTATTEAGPDSTAKIGQPPKYDEPTRHIGYKLPLSSIEKFKLLSELNGLSGTQYLLQVIEQEYQKNKDLIDKILELKSKAR